MRCRFKNINRLPTIKTASHFSSVTSLTLSTTYLFIEAQAPEECPSILVHVLNEVTTSVRRSERHQAY